MLDSYLNFSLPYITSDLPGIGGQLRLTPDHFVVEELPLYEALGEGQHLYVNLTKVGLTTKDVQAQLERLFGLKRGDVSFAGMKDKQARTTQTFSVNVGFQRAEFAESAAARIREQLPVEVHWVRFHRNKLRPGHLLGNRFTVTVTEPACDQAEALRRTEVIWERLAAHGLPNYFGPQRFGSGGNNVRQGLAILQGQPGHHSPWLRRFLVAAYQSFLCNRYLARRVELGLFERMLTGDVAKKHATGGMFQVEDAAAETPRLAAQEISFTAPMYGPKMWAATGEAGDLEAAVLAESPVGMDALAAARVEGTRRLGRLLAGEVQIVPTDADNALKLSFTLPKGAFATTLLREFMKVDLAQMPEFDTEDE
jgi:tRNA pseudouridine13 synthase